MLDLGHWRRWTFRLVPVAAALALVAGLVASRLAVETPAADLSGLVDRWTTAMPMGARGTGDEPASALLWRSETTDQALLLAVLTAGPDATAGDYLQENGDGR